MGDKGHRTRKDPRSYMTEHVLRTTGKRLCPLIVWSRPWTSYRLWRRLLHPARDGRNPTRRPALVRRILRHQVRLPFLFPLAENATQRQTSLMGPPNLPDPFRSRGSGRPAGLGLVLVPALLLVASTRQFSQIRRLLSRLNFRVRLAGCRFSRTHIVTHVRSLLFFFFF